MSYHRHQIFIVFLLHHHHRRHISLFFLHQHISIVFLLLHHHISIVFYPSPTRFIFFPPRQSIKDWQLPSLVYFVAMSRVVNNNRGFLQLLADCSVHQCQFLLKIATPHQLYALVQVLYNILMGHISIPPKNKRILQSYKDALLDLARPNVHYKTKKRVLVQEGSLLDLADQTSVTKQRSESLYKWVVVLLKIYWPLLFQA